VHDGDATAGGAAGVRIRWPRGVCSQGMRRPPERPDQVTAGQMRTQAPRRAPRGPSRHDGSAVGSTGLSPALLGATCLERRRRGKHPALIPLGLRPYMPREGMHHGWKDCRRHRLRLVGWPLHRRDASWKSARWRRPEDASGACGFAGTTGRTDAGTRAIGGAPA
jgi:hypothetical protein